MASEAQHLIREFKEHCGSMGAQQIVMGLVEILESLANQANALSLEMEHGYRRREGKEGLPRDPH